MGASRLGHSGDLTTDLLRKVSRSFYLTLRVLPRNVRPQLSVAYLLARTADTIADSELLSVGDRLEALQCFRAELLGERSPERSWIDGVLFRDRESAEAELLGRYGECFPLLETFSESDRSSILEVLKTIVSGQELDLVRFKPASTRRVIALETEKELDDYTFRVAGCVGAFWTKICEHFLGEDERADLKTIIALGIDYGKGLQLVNILRDLPRDLQAGRCYIPRISLERCGLSPADLSCKDSFPRFRSLYDQLLRRAESHLSRGWEYSCLWPRGQRRLRLACALPVLLGVRTLSILREAADGVLDFQQVHKVSRQEVRTILVRTVWGTVSSRSWENLYGWANRS